MLLALLVLALVATALALSLLVRAARRRRGGARRRQPRRRMPPYDPGRERRAEQRARELLRSCVEEEDWAMYRDLGFLRVGGGSPQARAAGGPARRGGARAGEGRLGEDPPYAYLIYPHKPIVAYVPETGRLLSEYCVEFPDLTDALGRSRLPASDDVLAKWMALTSDEQRVVSSANMHLVGRQLDPGRVRRDLWRLAEWERRRPRSLETEAR
jgi:hypothetical protein